MLEITANSKVISAYPFCKGIGQKVQRITVEHQVQPGIQIDGDQYYLCRTSTCTVVYYSKDGKEIILQNHLVNKIWFKNITPPIPVCYCANVTEEEILWHVAEARCCSTLEDIKNHTGANTGCECLIKNPSGA